MKYKRVGQTDINASILAFGASVFNNFFKDSNFNYSSESLQNIKNIISKAFELGINYFDVAPWYGNAQELLAIGLKDHDRSSYYLSTKVGRYNVEKPVSEWFDFSYQKTISSVEQSLKIFDTNYIDLIQIHDFEFADDIQQIVTETLPALDQLRIQGKVRYIGINSYLMEKLKELLELSTIRIDTVLTYTHLTLDDTSLLDFSEYFRSKGVGVINSAPLSMGLLTEIGPPNWHRAPERVREAARKASDYCKSKGVSLSKLAIHFSATNKNCDITIVSMSNVKLVEENVQALDDLNENEKNVLNHLKEKIFGPLNYKGYGDAEVISYKNKMGNN
ncbi:L-galactose dehydrogenase-like [Brachionus plicatilis]|uniref:L-galactose dehydrogenase-like n=1 Tax=Brachionus plicatilis TaxID=10195 RepID=A0A3M7Q6J3_BRAPC|nr:L-galactose dehydrogenase-like [Brachionus plicatilis]